MRPAPAIIVTVLLPDGQPAVKADVGLVAPDSALVLRPGGISRDNVQSLESLLTTDEAGRFSVSVDDTIKSIVIAHPEGFVRTTLAALAANPTIQLQSWSRIEGTLFYDGQSAPGRDLMLTFGPEDAQSVSLDIERYTTLDISFFLRRLPGIANWF
jgi:hypothetical protein